MNVNKNVRPFNSSRITLLMNNEVTFSPLIQTKKIKLLENGLNVLQYNGKNVPSAREIRLEEFFNFFANVVSLLRK